MSGSSPTPTPDCTSKCKSSWHADLVLSAVTKGTVAEIQTYCRYLCHNFWAVSDTLGRTALLQAASVGKAELVQWLLEQCHADIDVRDQESGWTSLHRALFYGQLHCARILLKHGASLKTTDFNGLTALDLVVLDRLPYIEYAPADPCEVYVWGSNKNFTLGLSSEQSPKHPEILEAFRRDSISVQKVEMHKFHSVFLANTGEVYTCGHGLGGRLGLSTENTTLNVTQISCLTKMDMGRCIDIAAGQDHTVFLMENGQVLASGKNNYHQLGLLPPPPQVLSPRAISMKFLKEKKPVGVCAARYHSVIYTRDAIYTFGLNAGQLGHLKGDRLQSAPRQISTLNQPGIHFTHVVTSDGAVVCATNKGDIYVSQEYKCRKIASKQLEIKQLSIVGGQLDDHCEGVSLGEGEKQDLRVAMLTRSGKVYVWQSSSLALTRCLFNTVCQPMVVSLCLNLRNIAIVTKTGEGFVGTMTLKKDAQKKTAEGSSGTTPQKDDNQKKASEGPPSKKGNSASPMASSLVSFLDRKECEQIHLKRLAFVNRATSITSTAGGESFAVLQSHPKLGLLYEPSVDRSEFQKNMLQLLDNVDAADSVHDVVVRVKGNSYPLHRYILMSRSEYFQKLGSDLKLGATITIDNVSVKAFEEVVCFMYTNSCTILENGDGPVVVSLSNKYSSCKGVTPSFLKEVQEASKKLGTVPLSNCLSKAAVKHNDISLMGVPVLPKIKLFRNKFKDLHDVILVSSDNVQFPSHRCILVARLEYFSCMLSLSWAESSSSKLPLPIPSRVLEVILDYLYLDDVPKLCASRDVEFLCQVLVSADELLITRLKQMCEAALADLVTLKNVSDLLEISYIYNAEQLKTLCMHFMCINLPAMLEASALESLGDDVALSLASCYKEMVASMSRRVITPYMGYPTKDELEKIQEEYGDFFDHEQFSGCSAPEGIKTKRKYTPRRESESFSDNKLLLPTKDMQNLSLSPATTGGQARVNGTCSTPASNHVPESPLPPKEKSTAQLISSQQRLPRKAALPLQSSPALDSTFPSLGDVVTQDGGIKSPKDSKHQEILRPMVKLSQKQRKQIAKSPEVCLPTPQPVSPWFRNMSQVSSASSLNNSSGSPAGVTEGGAFPNLATSSVPEPDVPNLSEIVKYEEQKLQNLAKVRPKALEIINVEERAIDDLLKHYHAEDNPEERISVTRILPIAYAAPIWKKKL